MNLPNKITTARMGLVVVLVALLLFPFDKCGISLPNIPGLNTNVIYLVCGIIFIVASLSDFLDGYIARKYNLVTNYGKFMDPIADKLLVDSALIILSIQGPLLIPTIIPVIMISRDLLVDGIRLLAMEKGKVIPASIFGKIKTVTQMVAIAFVFFNDWPFSLFGLSYPITLIFMYIAMFASVVSGIIYIYNGRELFKGGK